MAHTESKIEVREVITSNKNASIEFYGEFLEWCELNELSPSTRNYRKYLTDLDY